MTSDEARWADAHALLRPPPSDAELARLRRRLRLGWWIVGVLLVAAVATVLLTSRDPHGRRIAVRILFAAGILVGLAGILVGLIGNAASGLAGNFDSPVSALVRHQRRLLLREVHGRAPADPAHLGLTRHLAYRLSLPRPALPFSLGGLVLLVAAGWLGQPSGVRTVLLTVATVFFLALLVLGALQGRRARRFLAEHPAPPDVSGGEA